MNEQEMTIQQKHEVEQSEEATKPGKYFVPAVDIIETQQQVIVVAEMPGVSSEGVDVSLEDDVLTIRGCKQTEKEGNFRVLLEEYETGHYQRRFTVAETIDQEGIEATMNDGLLTVILPKTTPAKPKKIEVKVG